MAQFIFSHPTLPLIIYITFLCLLTFLLARRHSFGGGVIPVALLLQWIILMRTSSPQSKEVFQSAAGLKLLILPIILTGIIYIVCRVLARKGYFLPRKAKSYPKYKTKRLLATADIFN